MESAYPVNDFEPLMPGIVMAAVAVVHVFLAQFAVGGGMLLCYFQWLAMKGDSELPRIFIRGFFKALVLISFVGGAITGVGIWFTAIQVSPMTIGDMVHHFHWLWATEWTFFCLEIVAGYCFYRYHRRLDDRSNMTLLALYAIAAWASLFVINGILSWQLTPGEWVSSRRLLDGFFNPSFWPSLFYRTIVSLGLASLVSCVVINIMPLDRESRKALIYRAAQLMVPFALMPFLGIWFLATMPEDSRSWVTGGSPAMMLFLSISIGATVAIAGYAIVGLWLNRLYINGATATLLLLLAFAANAGGEFVREGARKPYSIRYVLFSNAIRPAEVATLREEGCLASDPFPIRNRDRFPTDQVAEGARVFRRLCAVCHTVHGTNSVAELTGAWDVDQIRMNIAKLQHTKPFMPPFAGTADEVEALVQFLLWETSQRPGTWAVSGNRDELAQIQVWLDDAGVEAGTAKRRTPVTAAVVPQDRGGR